MEIQKPPPSSQTAKSASDHVVTNPTGTSLFQGYNVTHLRHLSKKTESGFLKNLKKFAKFCWDPFYREKKRNEFFERAKSEIVSTKQLQGVALEGEKIENEKQMVRETIQTIMETSDFVLPESKKMELILFTINNSSKEVKVDLQDDEIKLKADQFFREKMSAMRHQIDYLASEKFYEKVKGDEEYDVIFSDRPIICSEKELNLYKKTFSKEVIRFLYTKNIPLTKVKQFVQELIDDPVLNFSEKEKIELLIYVCLLPKDTDTEGAKVLLEEVAKRDIPESEKIQLMLYAVNTKLNGIEIDIEGNGKLITLFDYYIKKTTEAINKMAFATALASQKTEIQSMLNKTNQNLLDSMDDIRTFEDFQERYIETVIQEMAKMYKGKKQALDVLEKNIIELLKFDPVIVLSKEGKEKLIASVKSEGQSV